MEKVTLTVGIPVYNSEDTIRETLDSIVLQYSNEVKEICDLEILVCDNCSNDETGNIVVNEYIREYPNINVRYHKNHENVGAPKNLDVVFNQAIGDYVWLCGDDIFCSDALMYTSRLINAHNPDFILHRSITFKDSFCPENLMHDPGCLNEGREVIIDNRDDFLKNENITHALFFISVLVIKKSLWSNTKNRDFKNLYPHASLLLENVGKKEVRCCLGSTPVVKCRYVKDLLPDIQKHLVKVFKIMRKSKKHFKDKALFVCFFKRIHWSLFEYWVDSGGLSLPNGRIFLVKSLFYSIYPRPLKRLYILFNLFLKSPRVP
jgi:glycosyltransferase involved in cell wall biosynthesis